MQATKLAIPLFVAALHSLVLPSTFYSQNISNDQIRDTEKRLENTEKEWGPEHPRVARVLYDLAGLYFTQGKYPDAEPLLQRSLFIREKSLGSDHPDVAASLHNLGVLYVVQGKYSDAEPLLQRSLAIMEKILGRISLRWACH